MALLRFDIKLSKGIEFFLAVLAALFASGIIIQAAAAQGQSSPSQESIGIVKSALPASFSSPNSSVEFRSVAAPAEQKVDSTPALAAKTLETLDTVLKAEGAKKFIESLNQGIENSSVSTISVSKSLEVIQATDTHTHKAAFVSIVKIRVQAPSGNGLSNVEVVEFIPKAAANSLSIVKFYMENPVVLEDDPAVEWTFAQVPRGGARDIIYTVGSDMSNLGTATVAVAAVNNAEPAPAAKASPSSTGTSPVKKPTPAGIIVMVVVIAVVVAAAWFVVRGRRRQQNGL